MRDIKFRYEHNGVMKYYTLYEIHYGFIEKSILSPEHFRGEYTGLMDINTKDGYEGDIIERDASDRIGKVKGVIVFEEGQFRVIWYDKNKGWNNSLYMHLPESKIISNIYQNSELLNQ